MNRPQGNMGWGQGGWGGAPYGYGGPGPGWGGGPPGWGQQGFAGPRGPFPYGGYGGPRMFNNFQGSVCCNEDSSKNFREGQRAALLFMIL